MAVRRRAPQNPEGVRRTQSSRALRERWPSSRAFGRSFLAPPVYDCARSRCACAPQAAASGSRRQLEPYLQALGSGVNKKQNDCTPLFLAVQNGFPVNIELLLQARADTNVRCRGSTVLHIAVSRGCVSNAVPPRPLCVLSPVRQGCKAVPLAAGPQCQRANHAAGAGRSGRHAVPPHRRRCRLQRNHQGERVRPPLKESKCIG